MKIIVENLAEAQAAATYFSGSSGGNAAPIGTAPPPSSAPSAPPPGAHTAPPGPAAPPASPTAAPGLVAPPPSAAPPAATPQPAPHGQPQPGWTDQHVLQMMQSFGARADGPEVVSRVLQKHGAQTFPQLDPAKWHLAYHDMKRVQDGSPLHEVLAS